MKIFRNNREFHVRMSRREGTMLLLAGLISLVLWSSLQDYDRRDCMAPKAETLLAWWGSLYPGLSLEGAMELVETDLEEEELQYEGIPVKICWKWFFF